jgi:methylated-DNA-[protein]-cysteine S-methyltransferase
MYYTRFHTPFCEMILVGNEEGLTHLHLNTGKGKRLFEITDEWVQNDAFFGHHGSDHRLLQRKTENIQCKK